MRYFLWINEKEGDEYCYSYRLDEKGTLWRWDITKWVESAYFSLPELKQDALQNGDLLLEAK